MTDHRQEDQRRYPRNAAAVALMRSDPRTHAEIDRVAREEIEQGRGFLLLRYEGYHSPY